MNIIKGACIGVIVLTLLACLGLGLKALIIPSMKLDRAIIKNSPQYVEGHRSSIVRYVEQYHQAASDGHRIAIKQLIKEEASRLPDNEVPQGAKDILGGYER